MNEKYEWLRQNGYKRREEAKKKRIDDLRKVLGFIMSFRGKRDSRGYVRISSNYFKKYFSNYHSLVRELEANGKISILRQFEVGKRAFGYKATLSDGERKRVLKWYSKQEGIEGENFGYLSEIDKPDIEDALEIIKEHTTPEAIMENAKQIYIENDEIMLNGHPYIKEFYQVRYVDSGKKYFYGYDKMKRVLATIQVWKYKDKLYADNNFVENKREEIRASWTQKVISFNEGHFYYKTSTRNGRSYDNLTIMPKPLLKLYKRNNEEFTTIDGKCYQAIIAKHLPKLISDLPILSTYCSFLLLLPPIVRGAFEEAVDSGEFYETIMKELARQGREVSRSEAKKIFFTAIFSKDFNNEWAHLLAVFDPEMKKQIDDFKRMFGYNHYAIALQLGESGIWSQVKKRLEELGIYYIGKHDSVLVPNSQWEEALEVIIEIHNKYLEKFHISVENEELSLVYNQDYQITKAA